jgi:quercetin dioxygenase-like cupin family protein
MALNRRTRSTRIERRGGREMSQQNSGFAIASDQAEFIRSPVGGDLTFLVRGERSNGTILALQTSAPPGEGPPLHTHTREEETIYVVSGDFRWQLGDELSDAPPGSFAFIPRGVAHTWQNIGEQPGMILATFMPAGMEGFFERLSRMKEFDPEEFRAAAAEQGTEVVGPPLAVSHPL